MPVTSKSQRAVMDTLMPTDGMTIYELTASTGYSKTLVRQALELLEHSGEVKVDRRRQPYLYTVSPYSPEKQLRSTIDKAKKELFNPDAKSSLIQHVRTGRKERWIESIEPMRALATAIEELAEEGMLIDTLGD